MVPLFFMWQERPRNPEHYLHCLTALANNPEAALELLAYEYMGWEEGKPCGLEKHQLFPFPPLTLVELGILWNKIS
jgi:hypothetical protein